MSDVPSVGSVLLDVWHTYKVEIIGVTYRSLPVTVLSEYFARVIMSVVDIFHRPGERRDKISRAVGLLICMPAAYLTILAFNPDRGLAYNMTWAGIYGGIAAAFHPLVVKYLPKGKAKA